MSLRIFASLSPFILSKFGTETLKQMLAEAIILSESLRDRKTY